MVVDITLEKRFSKDDVLASTLQLHKMCSNSIMRGEGVRINQEMAPKSWAV